MRIFFLLLAISSGAWAQVQSPAKAKLGVSGSVDWEQGTLSAGASLDLASAGIRLPTGRIQGEELLADEYSRLLRPYILSLQADSSSTIEDYISRRELTLDVLDSLLLGVRKIPPSLSADLALMTGRYTLDLANLRSLLLPRLRAEEIRRPLIPSPAAEYTGIIIIADGELAVHGRYSSALVQPCLFPKVWDTDMNLLYERNILDPEASPGKTQTRATLVRYVSESSIFRPSPSGLSPELAELVGTKPLRIIARSVFGVRPTDPIIDKEDALVILSSEANRRLLREGRVAMVLNEKTLRSSLGSGGEKQL
jgi:hypothetical protein